MTAKCRNFPILLLNETQYSVSFRKSPAFGILFHSSKRRSQGEATSYKDFGSGLLHWMMML